MIRPIIQALLLIALPMISLAEPRLRPDNWAHPVINSELGNLYQVDEGVFRLRTTRCEGLFRTSVALVSRKC